MEALVCGKSYVLVDFPRLTEPVGDAAEEDDAGRRGRTWWSYAADDLINWSLRRARALSMGGDPDTELAKKDKLEDAEWWKQTRWVYYDKRTFRIYEQVEGGRRAGRWSWWTKGGMGWRS